MPPAGALKSLAGNDRRPLLVLRECDQCKGTDHALFKRGMHNEKTRLLVRYFHCVKLATDVTETDHPLHRLFETKARTPAHAFVVAADGSQRTEFSGLQSQADLRRALRRLIAHSYTAKPNTSKLLSAFSRLDRLDARIQELSSQRERARKRSDVAAARLRKLERDIAAARRDLTATAASIDEMTDLSLRRPLPRPPPQPWKTTPKLPIRKIENFYIGHGGVRVRYYVDADDQRVGRYIRFYKSGRIKQRYDYVGGERWGIAIQFHENGQRKLVTHYESGLEHGERRTFDTAGKLLERQTYVRGTRQEDDRE